MEILRATYYALGCASFLTFIVLSIFLMVKVKVVSRENSKQLAGGLDCTSPKVRTKGKRGLD